MGFVPIELSEYVRGFLRSNRGETAGAVTKRLQSALDAYKAGSRCQCGAPIWVIGSAEAGNACFTCITGESDPSENYEIAEACDKDDMRLSGAIQLLVKNRSHG
jgi:Zn finger protein HypA/HybF involved in hydrogenase expression